jgi:hypothetical protein
MSRRDEYPFNTLTSSKGDRRIARRVRMGERVVRLPFRILAGAAAVGALVPVMLSIGPVVGRVYVLVWGVAFGAIAIAPGGRLRLKKQDGQTGGSGEVAPPRRMTKG